MLPVAGSAGGTIAGSATAWPLRLPARRTLKPCSRPPLTCTLPAPYSAARPACNAAARSASVRTAPLTRVSTVTVAPPAVKLYSPSRKRLPSALAALSRNTVWLCTPPWLVTVTSPPLPCCVATVTTAG